MKKVKRICCLIVILLLIFILLYIAWADLQKQRVVDMQVSKNNEELTSKNSLPNFSTEIISTIESNTSSNESEISSNVPFNEDIFSSNNNEEEINSTPIKKIVPNEIWYHVNSGLFTNDELDTVNLIIKKMNENRYSSLESERFEVSSSIGSDSYYKIVSFFAIYFGEWDTTRIQFIDVCVSNDYNTGIKKSEVVLYYNKIRIFQKNLEVVLNKIDSILKTFDDTGDTDILFQISNYLVDNVSYLNGYEDAYDAFIYNKTVCNGYATAFNMMANKAGITSDICIGTAYNGDYHAWNIVTLNNGDKKYYDTTLYRLAKNKKYINNSQNPNKTYILNDYSKELLV